MINKKAMGINISLNQIIGLTVIGLILFVMINIINSYTSSLVFEKNFLATDISLFTESIYASPNDLVAAYPQNKLYFSYKFTQGKVCVIDEDGEVCKPFNEEKDTGLVYAELEPKAVYDENVIEIKKGKDSFVPLVISKQDKTIKPESKILSFRVFK